jgi:glutamate dehydrogenase/leucine dehydrogenase
MAHGPDPDVNDRRAADPMRVCIVGSGELGRYTVEHALDRGYEVVAERAIAW